MKRILAFFACVASLLALQAPAVPDSLDFFGAFPPFLAVHSWHTPVVAQGGGHAAVLYELYLLNMYPRTIELSGVTTAAGGHTFKFAPAELTKMMREFGTKTALTKPSIGAGMTAIVYFWLPYESAAAVPRNVTNTISYTLDGLPGKAFTVQPATLSISHATPITIGPPLRGKNWYAGEAPSNGSGHRRTTFFYEGRPYISQRFAIDYVQCEVVASKCVVYRGDAKKNESYFSYGKPILAVAKGKVVMVTTNVADNTPPQTNPALTQENAFGNCVIIEIGFGRYAAYAHMIPHSPRVKVGDTVEAGQVIGRLGNSGNSVAPHLHFQVIDGPRFLGSEGVPYVQTGMTLQTAGEGEDQSGIPVLHDLKPATFNAPGMPFANELVTFP